VRRRSAPRFPLTRISSAASGSCRGVLHRHRWTLRPSLAPLPLTVSAFAIAWMRSSPPRQRKPRSAWRDMLAVVNYARLVARRRGRPVAAPAPSPARWSRRCRPPSLEAGRAGLCLAIEPGCEWCEYGRDGGRFAEDEQQDRPDRDVDQLLGYVLDLEHPAPAERQAGRQCAGPGRAGAGGECRVQPVGADGSKGAADRIAIASDIVTENPGRSGVGTQQGGEDPDRCGLACAVGPEQPGDAILSGTCTTAAPGPSASSPTPLASVHATSPGSLTRSSRPAS